MSFRLFQVLIGTLWDDSSLASPNYEWQAQLSRNVSEKLESFWTFRSCELNTYRIHPQQILTFTHDFDSLLEECEEIFADAEGVVVDCDVRGGGVGSPCV